MKTSFILSTASLAILSGSYFASGVQSVELLEVKGQLIFPSEELPSMIVCAVPLNSEQKQRLCVKTVENKPTFSIKIPPGEYLFSAEIPNYYKKAWMTSFQLDCGAPCHDNPIHVLKVKVKNPVTEICPCDWYTKKEDLIFPDNI